MEEKIPREEVWYIYGLKHRSRASYTANESVCRPLTVHPTAKQKVVLPGTHSNRTTARRRNQGEL